ncbi:LLM class flavin-dependent oxidoreductase [Allorhizocola rhizosphaerae]|uniref:LLM class flavin-dependent oxidoreductase n=1 Tax=Allorhizocola rhizosphaerae TaxID=1872709 RepID=UPI000E3DB2BD|nr:LLM class flavin-dependent oxidoreductase [Allorhizocola rhizosphaerae]
MQTRYAVGLPTVGEFGDPRTLLDLAVAAERHGWDGVHLWDHVLYHQPDWPVTSSTVTAAAIATATSRLRIILTVALPRRQFQDIAQDLTALSALSGGRLTIVATIGSMDREYSEFGLDPDLRARGRALDAGLARLNREFPIWCGGRWPNRAGLRRAARFDGGMPTFADQRVHNPPVEDFAQAAAVIQGGGRLASATDGPRSYHGRVASAGDRPAEGGKRDIAVEGASTSAADIAPYAEAGMTWWIEAMGWWRGGVTAAHARVAAGPPVP